MEFQQAPTENPSERRGWGPYVNNGGTVLAVAGKDYCIVGGDTRMSMGYSIMSRNVSKLHKLTNKCVLASAGMQAEATTLRKVLDYKVINYRHNHRKDISTDSISQMLSNTLYYKRFFPYYTFNVVGGLDHDGSGAVYGYDAIGSFERMQYCVTGTGTQLITPILDNQVGFKTQPINKRDLSLDEALDLVKDCFTCAGERDIYTGDSATILIITKDGIQEENFPLKLD
jgi:20S proteasome subunit beta 6